MEENRTLDPISGFYRKTDRFPNADCEWSDGKIETSYERQYSLVQRCQFTGRYMWYDEFDDTKSMTGDFFSLRRLDFNELYDAFRQFEDENSLAPEKRLMLLWEMVHTYNDIFNHSSLLITDYSSVVFDFAYIKKPIIIIMILKSII